MPTTVYTQVPTQQLIATLSRSSELVKVLEKLRASLDYLRDVPNVEAVVQTEIARVMPSVIHESLWVMHRNSSDRRQDSSEENDAQGELKFK